MANKKTDKKPKTTAIQDACADETWREYISLGGDSDDAQAFCTGAGKKCFEDWADAEGNNDFEAFVATLRKRYSPQAEDGNAPTDDKVAFTPDPDAVAAWKDYVANGGLQPGSEISFMDSAGGEELYKCAQDAGYEGTAAEFENLLNTISLAEAGQSESQDEPTDFNPISNIDPEAVNADLDAILEMKKEIRGINFDMKAYKKSLKKKGVSGAKLKAALEFRENEESYRTTEQGVRQLIMVLEDHDAKKTDDET